MKPISPRGKEKNKYRQQNNEQKYTDNAAVPQNIVT